MIRLRQKALDTLQLRDEKRYFADQKKISEIFGELVFDLSSMEEYLSEPSINAVTEARESNRKIQLQEAEAIAAGMRKWAMDLGATHFTHWFHPLTGMTAEKHDAFFKPDFSTRMHGLEGLSGKELVQQEPDASSFPNGGLRGTEEARGYTVWDPTSPAFILEIESGRTLYIPSVFVSYTGESLDYKAPLLKSTERLSKIATKVCSYLDEEVNHVKSTLGWEQEYFIVDAGLFNARPDLLLAGRTLVGSDAAKGHGKNDHYFGVIPERVQRFMHDFEREALRIGIPVLTRHNEVAPGQFECAPQFEEVNTSVDHNLLIMGLMERIARTHGLRVLFHEKPFHGLNGSGKHNNWSLITDSGRNVFSPKDNPSTDLLFLTFFIAVIRGVHKWGNVLRASIAGSGNDHRLGSNEAPPAIMAVFTGSVMDEILKNFQAHGPVDSGKVRKPMLEHGIPRIPDARSDATDRNRTSSFPFIGNRFEFRAVGSSHTCAWPMTVLQTALADALNELDQKTENKIGNGADKKDALISTLQEFLEESGKVIFNGDNYSEEWAQEALNRGLGNAKDTPTALKYLRTTETREFFSRQGVFTEAELEAVVNVLSDNYLKDLETESLLMEELVYTHVIPSATRTQQRLLETYRGHKEIGLEEDAASTHGHIKEIASRVTQLRREVEAMRSARDTAEQETHIHEAASLYAQTIKPFMESLRQSIDELEVLVDDNDWSLPRYHELLFIR